MQSGGVERAACGAALDGIDAALLAWLPQHVGQVRAAAVDVQPGPVLDERSVMVGGLTRGSVPRRAVTAKGYDALLSKTNGATGATRSGITV
jgi:hypothetical protein